jgi:hypothetical protein
MFCPYCNQNMIQHDVALEYWTCAACRVEGQSSKDVEFIWIFCNIKGQEYSVCLDSITNNTRVTQWERTADGFGVGTTIVMVPILLDITPSNIEQKLKLYMVFL